MVELKINAIMISPIIGLFSDAITLNKLSNPDPESGEKHMNQSIK